MRNLKKILALVLAMVMSLSLMATASAAETTAAAGDYELASKVLQGLDVVRGDEGGIRETDPITRAEVAALAYRIHTADVTDSQANLYYDLQDVAFSDLAPVSAWALGYIGYAHNAQIVKGNGDGTFNPTGNITGYEVLAMALRAIGYGKNHEFEGAEWQINTAAWARREGLLNGVSPSEQVGLDKPATRGMVFQILFNTIQHTDVQFSYVTGDLYIDATGANNTMALRLGLDKVTGVVMANEWADLESGSVMPEDKTRLKAEDGTDYTLDYATELEDIGESRIAYIRDDTTVLDLADAGNNVKDNEGEKTTVKDLRGSIKVDDTTEHFINFGDSIKDYSDWLIRYVVDVTAGNSTGLTASELRFLAENAKVTKGTITAPEEYTRTISPNEKIESADLSIMQKIFYTADRKGINPDNTVERWVDGEVYVGTSSLTDQSDIKSWKQFKAEYLEDTKDTVVTEAGNGEWLKIIDNNNDNVAEYVLLTQYVLDRVVDSTTKNDVTTFYYNYVDSTDYTVKSHTGYESKVGDYVLYAIIDDTVQIQLADTAAATFKAVNYKERQATTTGGETYEQSDIFNESKLPGELVEVDENVEYTLYLDKYGYVRAYSNETRYALITEVYPTNGMNQAWVTDRTLTAEVLKAGENEVIKEYLIENNSYYNNLNSNWNPFYTANSWEGPLNDALHKNFLQPATHSLDWNVAEANRVFTYNNINPDVNHSWTNVAKYTLGSNDNSINLYTAADRTNGEYREDYIQLAINDVNSKDPLYAINDAYYTNHTSNLNNHYVRAVDDTIFFVVSAEGEVRQYEGYTNVPDLKADHVDGNGIHAMYAVAVNSDVDVDTYNYWTANVIVIEIERFDDTYESIALIYSNDTKNSGDVKYLQVLDNAKGSIGIIPNNVDIWRGQFTAYGFYGLRNVKATDDANIYTADIYPINWTNNRAVSQLFNDNGIYFGRVRSTDEEMERSTYITVDVLSDDNDVDNPYYDLESTTTIRLASGYGYAWSIDDAGTYYNEADQLIFGSHGSNRVNEGDYIIWVITPSGSKTNTVGFIVDLSDKYDSSVHGWDNPGWLETIAGLIAKEQYTGNGDDDTPVIPDPEQVAVEYVVSGATATINGVAVADGNVDKGTELVIKIELGEGMDTLKINGNPVPAEDIENGVYTYTVTVNEDTKIEIEGSDSSTAVTYNVTFAYDLESNGGVNMWQDETLPLPAAATTDEEGNLTLKVGEDFPDVSGADYSDDMGWKLHLWIYVDGAESDIRKDPTADQTFTLTGDSTVYFYYWNQAGETGGDDSSSGGTDNDNNDDGFISGGDPEEVAARMSRGIQTLAIDNDDAAGLDTTWRAFCWVPNSAVNPGVKNAEKFEIVDAFREVDESDEPISDSVLNKGDATHTLYVFYFKMINGYVTPTFGDLGNVSLDTLKAQAQKAVEDAAAAAIAAINNPENAPKVTTAKTTALNGIKAAETAADIQKWQKYFEEQLAIIQKDDQPFDAPVFDADGNSNTNDIDVSYHLDESKDEEVTVELITSLINKNDKGITLTLKAGEKIIDEDDLRNNGIEYIGSDNKIYTVKATRVFEVKIDGDAIGYAKAGDTTVFSAVPDGKYMPADKVKVASSDGSLKTVAGGAGLSVASPTADLDLVTAYQVTLTNGTTGTVDGKVTFNGTTITSTDYVAAGSKLVVSGAQTASATSTTRYFELTVNSEAIERVKVAETKKGTFAQQLVEVKKDTEIAVKAGLLVKSGDAEYVLDSSATEIAKTTLAENNYVIVTDDTAYAVATKIATVDDEGKLTLKDASWADKRDADGVVTLAPAVQVEIPETASAFEDVTATHKYSTMTKAETLELGSGGSAATNILYVAENTDVTFKTTATTDATKLTTIDKLAGTVKVGSAAATAVSVDGGEGTWSVTLDKANGYYKFSVVKALTSADITALSIVEKDIKMGSVEGTYKSATATFTCANYPDSVSMEDWASGVEATGTIVLTAKDGEFFSSKLNHNNVVKGEGVTVISGKVSEDGSTMTIEVRFIIASAAGGNEGNVTPASVSLDETSLSLDGTTNTTGSLTATFAAGDSGLTEGDLTYTWSSSDTGVATVTGSGNTVTVSHVAKGETTITVKVTWDGNDEGVSATCTVTCDD